MFEGKEYILAVYKAQSFSKAARKLFISQPALSAAVKKEEKRLGCAIFDRSTNPIVLTAAGEIYVEAAARLMSLERDTSERIGSLGGQITGRLSLGGSGFDYAHYLPEISHEFNERYPQIQLKLTEHVTEHLMDMLNDEELDLLVDHSELDRNLFDSRFLCTEEMVLAVPEAMLPPEYEGLAIPDIQMADGLLEDDCPTVHLAPLGDSPFILFASGTSDLLRRCLTIFEMHGIHPRLVMRPTHMMTMFHLAARGIGCTFLPLELARSSDLYSPRLKYFRVDGARELLTRNIYIVSKKDRRKTPAMAVFLDMFTGHRIPGEFSPFRTVGPE